MTHTLESRSIYSEQCTRCSQCKTLPLPKSQKFASVCPSIDYSPFNAYSGGGKLITSWGYNAGKVDASPAMVESVYACTMCGACDISCKLHNADLVELYDTLFAFRAQLAKDGHVPAELTALVNNLKEEGTPQGLRTERAKWAEDLTLKDARKQPVDVLLHIGSENAYEPERWVELKLIAALLTKAGVDFGIVFEDESDSGLLAFDIGYQDVAMSLADEWHAHLAQSQAKLVLCADADSFAGFKSVYPRLGKTLPVPVEHTTEFIESLIANGKLTLSAKKKIKVAYHDSCLVGRRSEAHTPWQGDLILVKNNVSPISDPPRKVDYGHGGNYQAPRNLLSRLEELELLELERNKEFAYCCGGGCGLPEAYPEMAEMAAESVLNEAESAGGEMLVTSSAQCAKNLKRTAEKLGHAVQVSSLFDLITDAGGKA